MQDSEALSSPTSVSPPASTDALVEIGEDAKTASLGDGVTGSDELGDAKDVGSGTVKGRHERKPSTGLPSSRQPSAGTLDELAGNSSNAGSAEKLGGNKKTGSTGSPTTKINRFKKRIWVFQLILIVVVVALCSSQIAIAQSFFAQSKRAAAEIALDILDESHDMQKEIVLTLSETRPIFIEFLNGVEHTRAEVENILSQEITPFHLEINTIVDANKQIAASAFDKRYGTVYDPDGLVTKLFDSYSGGATSQSLSQIFTIHEILREDFDAVSAPFYLSTDADGYGNRYSMRIQDQGLIMYGVGAILSADGQSIIGAKIAGYLLTGKQKLVRTALVAIGNTDAFAGIWHKHSDSLFEISQFLLSNGLSESRTYTDYHDDFDQINSIYQSEGKIYDVHTVDENKYTIILSNAPKGVVIRNYEEAPEETFEGAHGAFFVGKSNTFIDGELQTNNVAISAFLSGTILVILVNAGLADRFFIQPIHALVIAVDKKDKDKINSALDKMKDLKMAVISVSFGFVAMVSLLGGMLLYNYANISGSFMAQSSAWTKQRYYELFYRERQLEHFVDTRGMALNPNFHWFMDPTLVTDDIYSEVVEQLQEFATEHEIELAFVVNASMNVAATATTLPSSSITFDPNGLITEILTSHSAIRANILMDRNLYISLNPASFGDSSLRVEATNAKPVIQFTGIPIFKDSWFEDPVGVIVMASALNGGKSTVTERAVEHFGDSCAGIFYVQDNEAVMVASAFRSNNGAVQIDAAIDTDEVKSMVRHSDEHGEFIHEKSVEILGEDFEVTVEQVYPGSQYDDDGHEHLSRGFDDGIYLMQCHSRSTWNKFTSTIKAISSVTWCGMFIASLVLNYMTFKPIYEFAQRYERKWSAKTVSSGGKLSLGNVVKIISRSQKTSTHNSSRHGSIG